MTHDDDLTNQLLAAQAHERLMRRTYEEAYQAFMAARADVRELQTEIANRSFAAVGVVMGKTVIRYCNQEMLAVGVQGGTLMVRPQTRSGKWFKNAEPLHRVSALDIVIVRQEGDGK